jgi:ClpP class serine protease
MGYFSQLDAKIKESLEKPEGSKLSRRDLIIRLHHAHKTARIADKTARETPNESEKVKLKEIDKVYREIAEKYFLSLVR